MEERDEAAGSFGSDLGAPVWENKEIGDEVGGEEEGEELKQLGLHCAV